MPPMMKNTKAVTPYMIPIRLWSTVNSHERQPVVATGRRKTPSEVVGVTAGTVGPTGAGTVGVGRSMIAIARCGRRRRWSARRAEPGAHL